RQSIALFFSVRPPGHLALEIIQRSNCLVGAWRIKHTSVSVVFQLLLRARKFAAGMLVMPAACGFLACRRTGAGGHERASSVVTRTLILSPRRPPREKLSVHGKSQMCRAQGARCAEQIP